MRREFAATLPERRAALDQAWRALTSGGWNAEDRAAAYRVVHSLAGASETFGFEALGKAARALNDHLHGVVETDAPPTPAHRAQAEKLHRAVIEAFAEA